MRVEHDAIKPNHIMLYPLFLERSLATGRVSPFATRSGPARERLSSVRARLTP